VAKDKSSTTFRGPRGICGLPAVIVAFAFDPEDAPSWATTTVFASTGFLAFFMLLAAVAYVFARPKFLIPPHLRDEPGKGKEGRR
jgi:hypothetical protein